jgi:hypothetical protein
VSYIRQSKSSRTRRVLPLTDQLEPFVTLILTEERILGERAKIEFHEICNALDYVVSRPLAAHFSSLSIGRISLSISASRPASKPCLYVIDQIRRSSPRRVDCD